MKYFYYGGKKRNRTVENDKFILCELICVEELGKK